MSPKGIYLRQSLAERFWPKVDVKGPDECWEWAAKKTPKGYGRIQNGGKKIHIHRVIWELHNGSIPEGLCVLHHCDNRACVNPSHLWLGTNADNMTDRNAKSRQARGERHGCAKLTEKKVREIRALITCGLSLSAIARKYGVAHRTIRRVKTGKNWGWLT